MNAALRTTDTYFARLLATVQHNGFLLRTINRREWTEELTLAAVRSEGRALRFIPEPSQAVVRAAVEQDGDALQYVVEQTDEICTAACRQWLGALHHIADDDMRERVIEGLIEAGVLATHPFNKATDAPAYAA
ncbi:MULTISPECIES: DUF4116 domain-containing protein [unclassified Variovorax]|uniref:DUF4116 domain-containing protein n=1 Tax=unclassified Variovorax TaxID=663243 RepID=UPI00076CD84B|nr:MULTISPECIES: DUF4116 domain-containing protein [unclassified Variovorax]KWT97723.1 hypothetical protein APY03_1275 [Variovorax sp. WDL1]PNG48822.1 hypothetical protein CHC06_06563 [Variovorax sp. B2]PNG49329.1 hypothetical protein CHC07_06211 [Variovorax sp. B4]VTV18383.1 hypothetical protein WDL1P2_00113 [Variovorax sp. WDL1]